MAYNPNTGYDDPNYDPNDPNGQNQASDPNTGQPASPQNASSAGVGDPGNEANAIQGMYSKYLGRNASDAELQSHYGNPNGIGGIENTIANSAEAQAYANRGAQPTKAAPGMPLGNVFTVGGSNGFDPMAFFQQMQGMFRPDPRQDELVNTLINRAGQSLNIDPNTDSVIRPQVDNYAATQERGMRKSLDSMAEAGSPYSTGALDNGKVQAAEVGSQNTANLQSTLVNNELSSRRKDITDALSQEGAMLTASQQLKLQQELGLLDAAMKQYGQQSNNDQFMADLGFRAQDRSNYWDALRSGQITG